MSLAFEKSLLPADGRFARPMPEQTDSRLNIFVVFTSVESTLAAMREAGALAASLGATITLLVPQIVPYPLPLESPPILVDFNEHRFSLMASQSPVETTVRIYLCRDRVETLTEILPPRSLVVLGGPKRWWPTQEEAMARKLRRAGYEVVYKETE